MIRSCFSYLQLVTFIPFFVHEDQFLSLICRFLCSIHPLNISHIGYLFPWGTSFLTIILCKKLYSHAKLSWKNDQKYPGNPGNVLEFQLGKRVATLEREIYVENIELAN